MLYWKALAIQWSLSLVCSLLVTGDKREFSRLLGTAIIAESAVSKLYVHIVTPEPNVREAPNLERMVPTSVLYVFCASTSDYLWWSMIDRNSIRKLQFTCSGMECLGFFAPEFCWAVRSGAAGAARAAPLFVAKFVIIARVHSLLSGATPH